MNWELINENDYINYNQELKFNDETFPLPSILPQDKFENFDPHEIFSTFFSEELIKHIIDSTNEYLENLRQTCKFVTMCPKRLKGYNNITTNEYKVYLGMKMYFNFVGHNSCKGISI